MLQVLALLEDELAEQLLLQPRTAHGAVHQRDLGRELGRKAGVGQARGQEQAEAGPHLQLPIAQQHKLVRAWTSTGG